MPDLAERFAENPLLTPADITPSAPGLKVECAFNPGAFRYGGRVGLVLRIAEFVPSTEEILRVPVLDPKAESGIRILDFDRNEPDADFHDQRKFDYRGVRYLTSLSHLRLAWSDDGINFKADPSPMISGEGPLEAFGVEDCRVTQVDSAGIYYLTFTEVSLSGVGVGLITTQDWQVFTRHGMILPPHNKDCALFPELIQGEFACLHRPSGVGLGGNYIWLARSRDGLHWGRHDCIMRTRPGHWDGARIGAGASPIRTDEGWLEIYHGADADGRYCLGAVLLDLDDPSQVKARSHDPIMEPTAPYEQQGFYGNCAFTNGHVMDGDGIVVYYGASDTVTCGARMSIDSILASLG